jgi:hypothetical protein
MSETKYLASAASGTKRSGKLSDYNMEVASKRGLIQLASECEA